MNQEHNYSKEEIELGESLVKCILKDLPEDHMDFIVSYCLPDIRTFYDAVIEAAGK